MTSIEDSSSAPSSSSSSVLDSTSVRKSESPIEASSSEVVTDTVPDTVSAGEGVDSSKFVFGNRVNKNGF